MSQVLPTKGRITQVFNTPVNYIAGRTKHEAVDIVTNGEVEYKALADCTVYRVIDKYSESSVTGYGNEVWLDYGNDIIMRSCHHAQGIQVSEGDRLSAGDVVARIGKTGYRVPTNIYHTHIEILIQGGRVDPLPIFNQLNEQFMDTLQQLRIDHDNLSKLYVKDLSEIRSELETTRTELAGLKGQINEQMKQKSEDIATLKKNKFGEKKLNKWYNKILNK